MKKIYFAFLLAFIVSSCGEPLPDFQIDNPVGSRLLIYAFPSDADDYIVNVSMTKSISGEQNPLKDLHVTCTTNGKPDEVTLVNIETHRALPIAIYRVHGKHSTGDEIHVKVDCVGVPSAEASTVIPKSTDVSLSNVSDTYINHQQYRVFKIGFQDHPSTDYYAVRVMSYYAYPERDDEGEWYSYNERENTDIYYDGSYSYNGKGHYDFYRISPDHEPLLLHYLDMNLDPWDENYKFMYIFNDQKITQPDVTMHLYAESCHSSSCTLQFYTLSPEYYAMLDRLNSQMNNELGSSGFSQMYATYNNIKGGYGCIAAYTMRTCEYVVEIKDEKMVY